MREITGTKALGDNPVIFHRPKEDRRAVSRWRHTAPNIGTTPSHGAGLTVGYCMALNGVKPVFGRSDVDKFLFAEAWLQFGRRRHAATRRRARLQFWWR
jgi:hypothetical protein